MRKKLINISDAEVEINGLGTAHAAKDKLDYLAGSYKGDVYNLKGCEIKADMLLAQTYPTENYGVFIRTGDSWHKTGEVSPGSPLIRQLESDGVLVIRGLSPQQQEQQERKAQEEREKEELAEQHRQERVRFLKARRDKELAKRNPDYVPAA